MSQCNRCIHCIMAVYCLTGDQFQLDKYQHNHQSNIRSACVCNFLDWNSRSHQAVCSVLQQSEYNLAWIDLWWVAVAAASLLFHLKMKNKSDQNHLYFLVNPKISLQMILAKCKQIIQSGSAFVDFSLVNCTVFFFFFQIRKSSRQYMHRSIFGVYFGGPTFV